MADVSLVDPYSAQQESIARRRRMAQALQQQAQTPLETPQTPGVLLSPYAGLAKVLQGLVGGYQEAEAAKEYKALGEEARKNQSEDLAKVLGAVRAPAIPGVEGRNEIPYEPAQIEKIYGTKPAPVMGSGYGSGMQMPDQVIGEKIIKPEVPYQAAITAVPGVPAGFISPDLLKDIKDPTARNLLLAQLIKQPEQETFIKGSPGDVFFDKLGNKKFSVPAAAGSTTLSPLGKLQSERAAIFASDPKDARLPAYDKAILKESEDQNLAFNREKFEWEKGNQGLKLEKVKNEKGEEVLMAVNSAGIARPVRSGTGEIVMSAAPTKMVHVEIEAADGSRKMVVMAENDPRFTAGVALRGPEYVSITTVNAQGMPEIRQVKKDDEILKTGYVKPLEGFLGQLQAAGVPMDEIRSDPKIRDLVDRYFVKTAGGVAPEDVFGSELRKAELVARLGELNIPIPANIKGLSLSVTPGVLGGSQSASAAPVPAAPAAALPFSDRPAGSILGKKVPGKGTEILVNGRVVGYAN
jgi:hypothetical protein